MCSVTLAKNFVFSGGAGGAEDDQTSDWGA